MRCAQTANQNSEGEGRVYGDMCTIRYDGKVVQVSALRVTDASSDQALWIMTDDNHPGAMGHCSNHQAEWETDLFAAVGQRGGSR